MAEDCCAVKGYTFEVSFRIGLNAANEKEAKKKMDGIIHMLGQDYPIARIKANLSKSD